jgi:D-beta-D-heptose 7-phosphate kinase/D-beta-D-heptose 1-phosphate adenosyltransferase
MALALGAGGTLEQSATLANLAGGIVVGKSGTAVVRAEELHAALGASGTRPSAEKLRSADLLAEDVQGWRARGLRVGFTNGCFDILHAGHVSLLKQARATCDRLIVALNSDASVRRLKGPSRPVNGEASRASVLSALEAADRVIFFDGETPLTLIERLRPDVLIKGADYTEDQVVGGTLVKSYGGRIALIPLTPDHSTTDIIRKVTAKNGAP